MKRKPYIQSKLPRLARDEGGFAMLWTLIAMIGLSFLAVAAHHISSTERIISENFEVEALGRYAADGALSRFFAEFVPTSSIIDEVEYDTDDPTDPDEGGDDEDAEDAVSYALKDFSGAALTPRTFPYGLNSVSVKPTKLVESRFGDIYMVEATAVIEDAAGEVTADRVVRTFARLNPFVKPWGAMTAPNGVVANPGSKHLHLDGKAKGKCGGEDISPLTVPFEGADLDNAEKLHLKPKDSEIDDSAESYQELIDALDMQVQWNALTNPAYYEGMNVFVIPDDYPDLNSVPKQDKSSWPTVLVRGDLVVDGVKIKNRGALIVQGSITLGPDNKSKLDWRGTIITGKELVVTGDAHLHAKGAVITGLNCTEAEIDARECRNVLDGKHVSVKYHPCDVEASMVQLLTLRQVAPSRHTRLY